MRSTGCPATMSLCTFSETDCVPWVYIMVPCQDCVAMESAICINNRVAMGSVAVGAAMTADTKRAASAAPMRLIRFTETPDRFPSHGLRVTSLADRWQQNVPRDE